MHQTNEMKMPVTVDGIIYFIIISELVETTLKNAFL